jgi:hypothetical protein
MSGRSNVSVVELVYRSGPRPAASTADSSTSTATRPVLADAAEESAVHLQVSGVGFRGLSVVDVRVGSSPAFTIRTDDTGTLAVSIAPVAADSVAVGTSVVALGRAPSGTSKTLIGSVPPRPTGTGPVDAVPWITVAVLVGLAGAWVIGRLREGHARLAESS